MAENNTNNIDDNSNTMPDDPNVPEDSAVCSFCGREADPHTGTFVFYGETPGVYICNNCIDSYKSRMGTLEKADAAAEPDKAPEHQKKIPTPKKLKEGLLDQYVIGQEKAKKVLATAVYNHYKMIRMKQRLEKNGNKSAAMDLSKSNMIIVGPTGAGR